MDRPKLSRLTVYPIKSLDGHDLSVSGVLPSGALAADRRYALVDREGKYINGKRCVAIHRIRATYSNDLKSVTLASRGEQQSFDLAKESEALAAYCGEILGMECQLVEDALAGMPDDVDSPGPTLVSTASLAAVAGWFGGLELAEVRRRFRFNLEVSDTAAFWEDGLVGEEASRSFRIGNIVWQGRGICQRCVVPSRDSVEGSATEGFAREFSRRRQECLPDWAPSGRFDHFYRLGVNTALASIGDEALLSLGDAIELIR